MLARGNTAKLFCLNHIDRIATHRLSGLTLLDLGCGTASNFLQLLRKHPHVRYVGYDPDRTAVDVARRNLAGLNAEVHHGLAYKVRLTSPSDIIVSFSVFEHVYRREAYLVAAKANLAPDGRFFINYDAGHFFLPPNRSFWSNQKNLFLSVLRRLGRNVLTIWAEGKAEYQQFVREQGFRQYLKRVGLQIVDQKMFNTSLKSIFKIVPEENRDEFMEQWLEVELWLNELAISYGDSLASLFMTRNFILTHA